jgi:hypothetical protein
VSGITAPLTGLLDDAVGDVGTITGTVSGPAATGGDSSAPGNGAPDGSSAGSSAVGQSAGVGSAVPRASGAVSASGHPEDYITVLGADSARGAARQAGPANTAPSNQAAPVERRPGPDGPADETSPPSGSASSSGSGAGSTAGALPDNAVPGASGACGALTGWNDRLPAIPTFDADSPPD